MKLDDINIKTLALGLLLTATLVYLTQLAGPYPMQAATARVATLLMSTILDAELIGTVIHIGELEIAVTEDCAGFNTLSVLAPLLMFWALLNRINLIVMAAVILPVCMLANTVRVILITTLALLGDVSLAMGLLHTVSGLLTFCLAAFIGIQAGLLWQRLTTVSLPKQQIAAAISITAFAVLSGYFLWIYERSPLDTNMLPLLLLGLTLLIRLFKQSGGLRSWHPSALSVGLVAILIGGTIEVQLLWLAGLLVIALSAARVWGAANHLLVLVGTCFFFSMPGLLQFIVVMTPNHAVFMLYLAAGLTAPTVLVALHLQVACSRRCRLSLTGIVTMIIATTFASASLLLTGESTNNPQLANLQVGYSLKGWSGRDVPLLLSEEILFNGAKLTKREYRSGEGSVLMLEVSSDQHSDIHPPQYCYSSAGWALESMPDRDDMSLFTAAKADLDTQLVAYYVELNGQVYPGSQLLLAKLKALVTPEASQWRLIRIATTADEQAPERLTRFAKDIR